MKAYLPGCAKTFLADDGLNIRNDADSPPVQYTQNCRASATILITNDHISEYINMF